MAELVMTNDHHAHHGGLHHDHHGDHGDHGGLHHDDDHLWPDVTLGQCASTDIGRPDQRQEPLVCAHLSFQLQCLEMSIKFTRTLVSRS